MFKVSYTVKASIFVKSTEEIVDFLKDHVHYIQAEGNQLYNNKHFLLNGHIYYLLGEEFQAYLDSKGYTYNDIDVESYEVVSSTPDVDVFFEAMSDDNRYELQPNVMAFVHELIIELTPPNDFGAELVDANTIKWSWALDENKNRYGHYVLDNSNRIIAQIPAGINYYVEGSLKYETNYTRRIVRYSDTDTSNPSTPVTITTAKRPMDALRKNSIDFKPKDDFPEVEYGVIDDKLLAFHSGIGDGLDLKLSFHKGDEFFDTFHLKSYIVGTMEYEAPIYPPVDFKYKFVVSGKVPEEHIKGFVTLLAKAYRVNEVKIKITSTVYKPMEIKWMLKAKVSYYEFDPAYLQEIQDFYDSKEGVI